MKKINLFAYAQLKPPSKYAPKTAQKAQKAKIHGVLYKLKNDAGVKKVGQTKSITDGKVLKVTPAKFKALAKMEKPQFKAQKTKTVRKEPVEVFKYVKKLPKNAKRIKNWEVKNV